MSSIYDISIINNKKEVISMSLFKYKTLLIVNTASKCGFTSQYAGLQELYNKYKDRNFEILAFPCNQFGGQEPSDDTAINTFCSVNFGVTFPIFAKTDVKGKNINPLFKYLISHKGGFVNDQIKWNFTKFLVDKEGNVVDRYAPTTKPSKIEDDLIKIL